METQYSFDIIWTNRADFKIRLEGARPYNSAMAMSTTQTSEQDHEEAMYLLHSLERNNVTLKYELDANVATNATPPSITPPPKIIATATTTVRDDTLITALKYQSATQTAQITKLLAALSAEGGSNGRGDVANAGVVVATADEPVVKATQIRNTNTENIANGSWCTRRRNATKWKETRPPALTGGIRKSMGSPDTRRGRTRVKK